MNRLVTILTYWIAALFLIFLMGAAGAIEGGW